MLVVARAGNGRGRQRRLDAGDVGWRQRELERAERFCELLPRARANQRHDGRSLGKHPGNRQLRSRRTLLGCHLANRLNETLVPLEVLAGKAWQIGAKVA